MRESEMCVAFRRWSTMNNNSTAATSRPVLEVVLVETARSEQQRP